MKITGQELVLGHHLKAEVPRHGRLQVAIIIQLILVIVFFNRSITRQ